MIDFYCLTFSLMKYDGWSISQKEPAFGKQVLSGFLKTL